MESIRRRFHHNILRQSHDGIPAKGYNHSEKAQLQTNHENTREGSTYKVEDYDDDEEEDEEEFQEADSLLESYGMRVHILYQNILYLFIHSYQEMTLRRRT